MNDRKTELTLQQTKAVFSEEKTLLVSASAGSGKTKVLVERVFNVLKSKKAQLSELLVVTFTNLAALEMKNRLKKRMEEEAKTDKYFEQRLDELNIADICTLHKLCQKIVKEFFYEADIEPGFSVADERQSEYLKSLALEECFNHYTREKDIDFEMLYEIFYESRKDTSFKENIVFVHNFLSSKEKMWQQQIIEDNYTADFKANKSILYLLEKIKKFTVYFSAKLSELSLWAESIKSKKLAEIISGASNIISSYEREDFEEVFLAFSSPVRFPQLRLPSNATAEETELKEELSEVLNEIKDGIKQFKTCFGGENLQEVKRDLITGKRYILKMLEVVDRFNQYYVAQKTSRNVLDFNDLEQKCLKVLYDKRIRETLQKRYKFIFVDEYQDTNQVQEKIINLLLKDNFIFMVGDIKQSIYGFRECEPQIFLNKYKDLSRRDAEQIVELNKNFRSDENILEFNNYVFENLMREETSSIDYSATSKFVFGEKFVKAESDFPVVSVCLLSKEREEEEEAKEELPEVYSVKKDSPKKKDMGRKERESHLIAGKISELLCQEIYDDTIKANRKIEYSDIAILSRTRDAVKKTAQYLMQVNIPVSAQYNVELFDRTEVKLLLDILSLINNFQQDIPLASVLKSFVVGLSNAELSEIRLNSGHKFFHQAVEEYLLNHNDEISDKIKKLKAELQNFKLRLTSKTISELIEEIIELYQMEVYYLTTSESYEENLQNMQFLKICAEQTENRKLFSFLNYIEQYGKTSKFNLSVSKSLNSVYLGTIHSSKGLEYPVVILTDTGREFSSRSKTGKFLVNGELGFGINCYDVENKQERENIIKNIIKLRISEEERQEEMRMLYVALTRAKNYLLIVGTVQKDKINSLSESYQINSKNNYLDWILGCLKEQEINRLRSYEGGIVVHMSKGKFTLEFHDYEEEKTQDKETEVSVEREEDFSKELQRVFNFDFRKNDLVFKNTVTAITQMEENDNYNISDFKLSTSEKTENEEDFLLIGNVYHKAMQYINFKSNRVNDIETQLNFLEKKNVFSGDERQILEANKLYLAVKQLSSLLEETDTVLREQPFMVYLPANTLISTEISSKVLVQGVVDLLIIKGDKIILVDYKTSRLKDKNEFKKRYKIQLDLYAKAVEKFYQKSVEKKYIYSFYLDSIIIV